MRRRPRVELAAGGLLTGRCRRDAEAPEGTRRFAGWDEPPVRDEGQLYAIVDVLVTVAETHGDSAARVALAWPLTRPAVNSVIVGARGRTAGRQFACRQASAHRRRPCALEQVDRPPPNYPHGHQAASPPTTLAPADLAPLQPFLS